ncbi:hypothetical protein Tco_0153805 [Tanacetum coccineum]
MSNSITLFANSFIDMLFLNAIMEAGLQNPPYIYQWAEKTVPVAEGSSETTTERYMENYKNVSQDIRDQMNAEAEAVQIILTGIDNDIYSTVDASCPNGISQQSQKQRKRHLLLFCSYFMIQNLLRINVDDEMSKEKGDVKTHGFNFYLVSGSAKSWDSVLQCKEYGTCFKGILNSDQLIGRRILDDESVDLRIGSTLYVKTINENYNVFAMENAHPEQLEPSNDIYLKDQGDSNITIDSSDICYDRAQDDQDETDNLDQERDLLASLIHKLKCEIDDSKTIKFLESIKQRS